MWADLHSSTEYSWRLWLDISLFSCNMKHYEIPLQMSCVVLHWYEERSLGTDGIYSDIYKSRLWNQIVHSNPRVVFSKFWRKIGYSVKYKSIVEKEITVLFYAMVLHWNNCLFVPFSTNPYKLIAWCRQQVKADLVYMYDTWDALHIVRNYGWGISCEITLRWSSLEPIDDKSTLVWVMACCHQATSHYLSQC